MSRLPNMPVAPTASLLEVALVLAADVAPPDRFTIGFGNLRVMAPDGPLNAPAADTRNEIDADWLTRSRAIEARQFAALIDDDGDAATGAFRDGYERAFNLADARYAGRVTSLAVDNDAADPVVITASGKLDDSDAGDLTHAVRYTNGRGFGVDSGPDDARAARWLDDGDALDFALNDGELEWIAFTVRVDNQRWGRLALDVDGDTLRGPSEPGGNFVNDFALSLTGIRHDTAVFIDLVAEEISGATVIGRSEWFFRAFDAAGRDNVTIGTLGDGAPIAVQDLQLGVVDDGGAVA